MIMNGEKSPLCIPDVSWVESRSIIGVQFNQVLSLGSHLPVVGKATRYALKTIKEHGLVGHAIWDVTRAALVSHLQYASPAWSGQSVIRNPHNVLHQLLQCTCSDYSLRSRISITSIYTANHIIRKRKSFMSQNAVC